MPYVDIKLSDIQDYIKHNDYEKISKYYLYELFIKQVNFINCSIIYEDFITVNNINKLEITIMSGYSSTDRLTKKEHYYRISFYTFVIEYDIINKVSNMYKINFNSKMKIN